MPKKAVRLFRIDSLDPTKMLGWAKAVGDGNRQCWLDRGLLRSLDHVEEGMLVVVTFNAFGEPVAVRPARTE